MNKLSLLLQEDDTDIQLAELGTEILRELFMAAKKLAVYQPDHPQALRAIERPHLLFRKWFAFSTVADLLRDGSLVYFGGVEMPRGPFTDGLVRDLDALQLKRVVFLPHLTEQDLLAFLTRLQERVPLARVESFMWNHLEKQGITSIRVNDPEWNERLAGQRRFRAPWRRRGPAPGTAYLVHTRPVGRHKPRAPGRSPIRRRAVPGRGRR